MTDTPILLFVYGTLRRGCPSGAHQRFLKSALYLASGRVQGKLYRVDTYPGLIPSSGDDWVTGEVYQLPDSAALAALDDYEGCGEHCPAPREYRREKISVKLSDDTELKVWGYYYNWPTERLALIASGDFLNPRALT